MADCGLNDPSSTPDRLWAPPLDCLELCRHQFYTPLCCGAWAQAQLYIALLIYDINIYIWNLIINTDICSLYLFFIIFCLFSFICHPDIGTALANLMADT
jgi:hypothetical protein